MPQELIWFWEAYWELDTERRYDNGFPRSIPWSVVKQYAEYHSISFEYLLTIITGMDEAYLKHKSDEYQKKMDEIKSKGNRQARYRKG